MRSSFRAAAVLLLPLVGVTLIGCSALGPSSSDADATGAAFGEALSTSDGAAACALLNAAAVEDVESQTGLGCSDGVLTLDLPVAEDVQSAEVYGRSALLQSSVDSLFLTVVGSDWKIRAAGCTPVQDAPFDCVIEGS